MKPRTFYHVKETIIWLVLAFSLWFAIGYYVHSKKYHRSNKPALEKIQDMLLFR